jgi:hypothetical protein
MRAIAGVRTLIRRRWREKPSRHLETDKQESAAPAFGPLGMDRGQGTSGQFALISGRLVPPCQYRDEADDVHLRDATIELKSVQLTVFS